MDFTLKLVHMMGLLNLIHYTLKKIRIAWNFNRTIKRDFSKCKKHRSKKLFL